MCKRAGVEVKVGRCVCMRDKQMNQSGRDRECAEENKREQAHVKKTARVRMSRQASIYMHTNVTGIWTRGRASTCREQVSTSKIK